MHLWVRDGVYVRNDTMWKNWKAKPNLKKHERPSNSLKVHKYRNMWQIQYAHCVLLSAEQVFQILCKQWGEKQAVKLWDSQLNNVTTMHMKISVGPIQLRKHQLKTDIVSYDI